MGQQLSGPLTSKIVHRSGTKGLKISGVEMQGKRLSMEDATSISLNFYSHSSDAKTSFFGVFDGHGSGAASLWVAEQLPKELAKKPQLNQDVIVQTCLEVDQAYLDYYDKLMADKLKQNEEPKLTNSADDLLEEEESAGGTTAVFAIVEELNTPLENGSKYRVTIGNIGDSRAVIIRNTDNTYVNFDQITDDHKPTKLSERERINAAGSYVSAGRVEGRLALSRAFGDFDLKEKPNILPENQPVSVVPDVFVIDDIKEGDMLLLFCDGLYEHANNRGIVDCLQKHLQASPPDDPAVALCELLEELVNNSEDNMSCLLVEFKEGTGYSTFSTHGEKEYKPMSTDQMMRRATTRNTERFVRAYKEFENRYDVISSYSVGDDLYKYLTQ